MFFYTIDAATNAVRVRSHYPLKPTEGTFVVTSETFYSPSEVVYDPSTRQLLEKSEGMLLQEKREHSHKAAEEAGAYEKKVTALRRGIEALSDETLKQILRNMAELVNIKLD